MNRLAVDPGPSATGYAIETSGTITRFGTKQFRSGGRKSLSWEPDAAELFAGWLAFTVQQEKIGQLMVESAFVSRRSPDIRWVCWAYVSSTLLCKRLGVDFRPFGQSVMKRFATGNGRAKPAEMIAAAKARGYDVKTDHEADAIFALLMSREGAMPGPLGAVA